MAKGKNLVINEYHLHRNQPDRPQFAIYHLNDYLKKNKGEAAKPHIHSFYQIIWFKKGGGKHFVDFNAYDVFDNVIYFVAKNQVHYFDTNIDYNGILIHFNDIFLIQKDDETNLFLKYNLFNNHYRKPYCFIGKDIAPILNGYLLQIQKELNNKHDFGHEELLRNYLKSFLIQVQRRRNELDKIHGHVPATSDEKGIQLIKLRDLIEENYDKGFSVAEYAHLLFVSSRTLSGLTRQLLNKTPSQLIQDRIILEAERLLLHSSLNVNQISYRLGFDDPSYFVKYFKKHTKMSPSAFRRPFL